MVNGKRQFWYNSKKFYENQLKIKKFWVVFNKYKRIWNNCEDSNLGKLWGFFTESGLYITEDKFNII